MSEPGEPEGSKRPVSVGRHWPLVAGLLLFGVLAAVHISQAVAACDGRLVYALDDPYIHMAMAKHQALHGVWGVTKYGFSSSSSSPLWTALLAIVYFASWPSEAAPLVLNLLAGVGVLVAAYGVLGRVWGEEEASSRVSSDPRARGARLPRGGEGLVPAREWATFAILAGLVLFTPLPGLCLFGLEHLLHTTLVLAFAGWAAAAVAEDAPLDRKHLLRLGGTAALLVGCRYEGLFLAGPACLLLLLRRRVGAATAVALGAALPVVAYGAVSVAHGWWFLPNSVLLKGKMPDLRSVAGVLDLLGYGAFQQLARLPVLLLLFGGALALLVRRAAAGTLLRSRAVLLLLFVTNTVLHFELAKAGIFYRYEAYLVAFGLVALGAELAALPLTVARPRAALAAGAILLLLPLVGLVERGARAWTRVPRSCRNVYEQQYQMARFLLQSAPEASVAANDVGAVGFFTDVRLLDLWGLGNMDTARAIRTGRYFLNEITALTEQHGVQVALVYEKRYQSGSLSAIPRRWAKVGEWRIRNNEALGEDTVSVFAADPALAPPLAEAFRRFAATLPSDVQANVAPPGGKPSRDH